MRDGNNRRAWSDLHGNRVHIPHLDSLLQMQKMQKRKGESAEEEVWTWTACVMFTVRVGAVSRPSCVQWEPSGPEMNEGVAATHYFSYQVQRINTARHTSAADLWGGHVAAEP